MTKEELVDFIMTKENIINHIAHVVASSSMSVHEIMDALPSKKLKRSFDFRDPWGSEMRRLTDKQEELEKLGKKRSSRYALTRVWEEMSDGHKTNFLQNLSEDVLKGIYNSYQKNKKTNGINIKYETLKKQVKAEREKLEKKLVKREMKRRLAEQQKTAKKV